MHFSRTIFLLVLLCFVFITSSTRSESSGDVGFPMYPTGNSFKTPIYFSFITDSSGSDLQINSSSLLAARLAFTVDLTLYYVNQNFPNYYLLYKTALDSECDRTTSLNMFFKHFQSTSQPTYLSSLCCGCSAATIPVAEISHYWNIPQISFSSGAEELNDRSRFQSFFRTIPSFKYVAPALTAVVDQFGWRQMVVIAQNDPAFDMITQGIQESFDLNGWNLQVKSTTDSDIFAWDRDYRIVFVGAYIETTLDILCEAVHRNNLKSSDYIWITMAWSAEWWETSSNASCPPEVMQTIANNSLLIIPDGYLVIDPSEYNFSSIVSHLDEDHLSLLDGSGNHTTTHFIFPPGVVFDAVLALALGLMGAADRVSRNDSSGCDSFSGELVPLEEFSYFNDKMGCILHQSVANLSFVGVTGRVEFNENGSRLNDNHIALLQYRMVDDLDQAFSDEVLRRLRVANIIVGQKEAQFYYTEGESVSTVWPDGVPYDGSPVQEIDSHHLALVVVYAMLASAGLIYAAICLAFNVIFRNRLVVKLSSPVVNYLILIGAVLLYVTVFFLVLSSDDVEVETIFCNIELWLFSVGYTLCFAVFLAKTWRVYYIFTNPVARKKKVLIKDWVMFAIVGVVVGVQVIILVVGTTVPQIQPTANITDNEEHPTSVNSEGENVENAVVTCALDSIPQRVWIVISLCYMALLELVAMFMAFHTRKVRIKAINDSKEIGALVYINSIIIIVIAIALLGLSHNHDLFVVVLGLCLILASTIFLSLVFIPTAVRLYRDPDGEKALLTTTVNNTSDRNMGSRTLSVMAESPSRALSFTYRPSVSKTFLPTLKEDDEEKKENLALPEKVVRITSLDDEPNLEEKNSCGNGRNSTNSHHYKETESKL